MNLMNPDNHDDDDALSPEERAALSPLGAYDVPIPTGLKRKILLAARMPALSVETILKDFAPEAPSRRRLVFNRFADFAATAAAIVLISSAIFLSSGYTRQQARKALCAANLGSLGSAIAAYANDFPNQLPHARMTSNAPWYDAQRQHPRRQNLYVLVKRHYASPNHLVCPEERMATRILTPDEAARLDDFPAGVIVSFSFQNLNGDANFTPELLALRWKQAQNMVIMSDRTPLLSQNQLKADLDLSRAVSANHAGLQGQNILILDGRVLWQQTPVFGPQQDNFWRAGDIQKYSGRETPANAVDCFLAP